MFYIDPLLKFNLELKEAANMEINPHNRNATPKYAHEFLKLIDDANGDEKVSLLKKYAAYPPLNYLLSLNFNDEVVLDLPIGVPPHKRNAETHPDLYAPLATQIRRLQSCIKSPKNATIQKRKKEHIFIQMIEGLNEGEANVLVSCKDKNLTLMYPTITKEFVGSILPTLIGIKNAK
jgi:hypothetical protein